MLTVLCSVSARGAGEALSEPGRLPAPGRVLERQLAGGETHRYRLANGRGQDLWLVVVQDGIDVTVSIVGADGEARLTVDSPGGLWGEEWLRVRAGAPAGETIEIRAPSAHGAPGRYRLSLEPRSPAPSAEDLAERAATDAGRLNHQGTREAQRRALDHYRQALGRWRALEQPRETARALFLLGMLHRWLGEPREALALLRRALAEWRHLGDRKGEAQARMEIASTARMLGENQDVEETYQQALGLWRELGDLQGQALTLNYLGLVRARTAPRGALEPYAEALGLFRRLGDALQEGVVLNNIGGVYDLLGEPRLALDHFRRALDIHRLLGDRRQQAAVWNNMASVRRRSGRLQEALDGYGRSLDLRRELGDRRGEGRVLNNLGMTYLRLGDVSRARGHLRQALLARRQSRDRRGEAVTLSNLGGIAAREAEWEPALELYAQALALRRSLSDRGGEAATLLAMGRVAGELGKTTSALRHLEASLAILEEMGNPVRQGAVWRALGQVRTASDQPERAIDALERSLELLRSAGDQVEESETLLALARAELALGRSDRRSPDHLPAAWRHSLEALELLESLRAGVDSLGLRASFLSGHDDAFEFAVDLAMELDRRAPTAGWAAKALEVSERARARSLLDLLKESGAGLRRGVDAVLLERQQELLERLNAKVERRRRHLERKGPSAESERLAGEAGEVLAQLEEVENAIRRQSPTWDALERPRPLDASAVQALLDPETMLFQYALGEERSFLWAVTAQRIESFELPARAVIEAAVREAYDGLRIQDPRAQSADAESVGRLSRILLMPLAERLTGQRLAIVADGALHYLPFAALPHPVGGEPLIVRHEIVALPSASTLGVQRQTLAGRPPAEKALAVVADPVFGAPDPRLPASGAAAGAAAGTVPDSGVPPLTLAARDPAYREARSGELRLDRLAWSRWEAETLAAHAGDGETLLVLGFDADLAAVRGGRLKGHRIVHFATHGIVESEHPELSALVLSLYDPEGRPREGFLRLPEIYNLDLDAETVVLSGCGTALGQELRGEGLVGLTRGFFAAGARRLVASLWRVQDRSAAELMDRFYRRLLRDGQVRPAAALREAQLELMREPEFADPYHWAAFAVYGDWR